MPLPRLYKLPDAAEALHVSLATVRKYVRDGRLASLLIGRNRLVTEKAVAEFISNADTRRRPTGFAAKKQTRKPVTRRTITKRAAKKVAR